MLNRIDDRRFELALDVVLTPVLGAPDLCRSARVADRRLRTSAPRKDAAIEELARGPQDARARDRSGGGPLDQRCAGLWDPRWRPVALRTSASEHDTRGVEQGTGGCHVAAARRRSHVAAMRPLGVGAVGCIQLTAKVRRGD